MSGPPQPSSPSPSDTRRVLSEEFIGLPSQGHDDAEGSRPHRRSGGRQLAAYAVTLFVLVSLAFLIPRVMPGDPLLALIDPAAPAYLQDSSLREELAEYYGLDQPLLTQYGQYLEGLVRRDLGTSIRYNRPVAELVAARLPWTLLLIGTAMALAIAVGVISGIQSAWRRDRPVDRGMLAAFLGFRSFPVYFLASLAVFVFAARLGWFPLGGEESQFVTQGLGERVLDIAHHLALPALILATQFAAGYYLLMRAGVVTELGADYLKMGRAKGLGERPLKYRYAARNAMLPVVTQTAMQFGSAVTGTIFVETVFTYQGMGRLMFEAVEFRDYPILQAGFAVFGVLVVTVNFAADMAYHRIDPRTAA